MNSAAYVARKLEELKTSGVPLSDVAWQVALLCNGWSYVFGTRGDLCTPANRRARKWETYPSIKDKCKNFAGTGSCNGCKWFPGGERTRCFDCRGFTYWVLLQVYGWKLAGVGATSQWNTASNWKDKGSISTMPRGTLVCLFVQDGTTMEHTGFGYNNETIECSGSVFRSKTRNKKWTHWAIPACVDTSNTGSTTLRKGEKGAAVQSLQEALISQGFPCGKWGADGDFGTATESAVKAFQAANGLVPDGIAGTATWAALRGQKTATKYTVTIPHLSISQADALKSQYPGTIMAEERG